jgi:hypothetical protein
MEDATSEATKTTTSGADYDTFDGLDYNNFSWVYCRKLVCFSSKDLPAQRFIFVFCK